MAIASMQKVMIVAHRSQAADLLAAVQNAGIVQILDAERAMVTIEWPELMVEPRRHRDLEESIDRLNKAIAFLKPYADKDQTSLFAPRVRVDYQTYTNVISTDESTRILDDVESVSSQMDKLAAEADSNAVLLERLLPWESLTAPIEELDSLYTSTTFVGLIPEQFYDEAQEKLAELGAAIEEVDTGHRMVACLGVCLDETAGDVQKALRSVDFEAASFEGLSGLVSENIERLRSRQTDIGKERADLARQAKKLAKDRLKLQILFDHYENLHSRIHTESSAPATEHAIFLEGWVKKKDYQTLEKLVTQYDSCDIAPVEPGQDEEIPVEIDNGPMAKPFEMLTRLHGMPQPVEVDPTIFLAPFFALFFGLCLTDAGYALVMVGAIAWLIHKIRGDKKLLWLLMISSVVTVFAGALTGGWFGDAVQQFLPALKPLREKMMWFDPLEKPMVFFGLSLVLGFMQILFGIFIAFFHKIRRREYIAAFCDHFTWIVFLLSFVIIAFGASGKAGVAGDLLKALGKYAIIVSCVVIVLFSQREGGIAGRLGMGAYNLFSAIFYVGDILSYVRLMALGITTAGLAMAINVIAQVVGDIPVIGIVLATITLILGHLFNILMSALSAFVHSLRLQYVEFFSKFYVGGGRPFTPLNKVYRYIELKK